ncbi:Calmodulin-binding transcription activator 4 [Morella rubra]|uniref:Calmodulin-binding transcription activator 4 n=1 Tax=Morella rubra TaxID=262757 RepID=A0A6A1UM57_9ROSI|nr:Calmodulin-binding transcription activator 4 [Morella rubra]KAB1201277.1 Calmodulin-binding transcription activator 4 [Morella rubra]
MTGDHLTGGSVFLFNKRVLRFFRRDGHNWRKKKDGRTVGEAHERLKVGNAEALNCYYAHGEQNPNFQRRSYWMLDPAYDHIVLVHYRELSEGRPSSGSVAQLSPGSSSTCSQSPSSYTTQNPGSNSIISEFFEPYQSLSSPGSEVSSGIAIKNDGMDDLSRVYRTGQRECPPDLEVTHALRRLEEQLSLGEESIKGITPFYFQDENPNEPDILGCERENSKQEEYADSLHSPAYIDLGYGGHAQVQDNSNSLELLHDAGDLGKHHNQSVGHDLADGSNRSLSWEDVFESFNTSSGIESQRKDLYPLNGNEELLALSRKAPKEEHEHSHWQNFNVENVENTSWLLPEEADSFRFPTYSSVTQTHESDSDYYTTLFDQGKTEMLLEADSSLTVGEKQKFTIREMSPEWGFTTEFTKVVIIGSFLCDPLESPWACMFGDIEVPVQIIQEGVICCEAPSHLPGKVTLCITSGNRESCSEVREFEYRMKTSTCNHCTSPKTEVDKSPQELLLLVRFVQMLLSDSLTDKGDNVESENHLLGRLKADDDLWDHVIEALLVGSGNSSSTIDWVLQALLKDKLHQWLLSRTQNESDQAGGSLSKQEKGIIHMVAGLGFDWALNPLLSSGVNINFRDINGWTALHWAARFGREKTVAALIASGASPGAVTDPTSQDPQGKTPASIAAASRHKGLAGYLSEFALTSHLTSLTLEESEFSKGSAEVEAEITVNSISKESLAADGDQLSLKNSLAAVRNAAQAAARIQSAFRAHSFRKRQQREVACSEDDYGINSVDISAVSKLAFRHPRDYNSAAVSIQKKYRGWKGRKDFLAFRQKVVKIQAHVRGYQVRKHYKVICWAVGILDKVVLRWRRKGVGLRGFRNETERIDESESEDEDILKVFRKQKVDGAIDEAVSRVMSMVESAEARQQYHRVLERYRQAKAELAADSEAGGSTSLDDAFGMEEEVMYHSS